MFLPKQELQLPTAAIHQSPNEYLETLYEFIENYRWLADLHVGDFITLKHWERLDPSWRQALLPDSFENELAYQEWFISILNLTTYSDVKESWPSSLKEYLRLVKDLPLPRRHEEHTLDERTRIDKHMLAGGMSDKKIHEVELLANLIKQVGNEQDISQALDLGSGQGYLSRIMAFQHDMKVLAVDMSEVQTKGAERFDQRAIKALRSDNGKLRHVTEMVTPDNVWQVLSRYGGNSTSNGDWIVCGLHTCGDLATSTFRLFVNSQDIKWLVNVGCCYHFLSEGSPQCGFPMSDKLRNKRYQLGNSARVLACQSPSTWTDPVIGQQSFNQYFYRAVLLHAIVDKGIADKAPPIGMIKRKKTFQQYYQAAMKRLKFDDGMISSLEAEDYYRKYKHEQVDKQIIVLWTLRVLLGPVLESLILMDRWVYLKESPRTEHVWMFPLFDAMTSPRNMCIVASNKT